MRLVLWANLLTAASMVANAVLITFAVSQQPQAATETEWTSRIATQWNAQAEYRLPDDSRVDILDDVRHVAWEADWAGSGHSNKWAEAVGQSLYYAASMGPPYRPGVLLLMDGGEAKHDWRKALTVVTYLRGQGINIEFRAVDVANNR